MHNYRENLIDALTSNQECHNYKWKLMKVCGIRVSISMTYVAVRLSGKFSI